MSTNYYARRIPSVKEKEELKNLIDNDKFDTALDKAISMYQADGSSSFERYGSLIHLGSRNWGWKFLWDPNHWIEQNGRIENGVYVPNPEVHKYYELNLKSIREFLSRDDIMIISENYRDDMPDTDSTDPEKTEVWTVDEFIEMALTHCPDGYDSKKYEMEKTKSGHVDLYYHKERVEMFRDLGYKVDAYDFYNEEGLRFSIFEYFR